MGANAHVNIQKCKSLFQLFNNDSYQLEKVKTCNLLELIHAMGYVK